MPAKAQRGCRRSPNRRISWNFESPSTVGCDEAHGWGENGQLVAVDRDGDGLKTLLHRANNCDHVPMGCRKFLTERNPQLCNGGQTIAVGEREKSSAATSSLIAPPQPLAGKIYCSAGDANLASAPHDGEKFYSIGGEKVVPPP
ncbi:hypothetical protein TIFTF001_056304 [Ficus carica]|uniref:Uncharacterized protein n=1 Tax=Ficus carica TaxID=3494 RepID=A0AA88EHZ7_FICCA|nr:hypothetical protein TIFTF001_056301 [Ficus carica]GMN75361.1 hypothetical protein TIFTF001_056302 [Ficus carica]GMN75370.1 hypothetical protein TIFTF001_056303 [Ficus carica]GMN75374.1 hypothetical protein TIFTF001_056304 [Ficus carica]